MLFALPFAAGTILPMMAPISEDSRMIGSNAIAPIQAPSAAGNLESLTDFFFLFSRGLSQFQAMVTNSQQWPGISRVLGVP